MAKLDYIPISLRYVDALKRLNAEQVGRIVFAALDYAADGELPGQLDALEDVVFCLLKGDTDRVKDNLEEVSQQNRRNAGKRWNTPDSDASASENATAYENATASNHASASENATAAIKKERKNEPKKEPRKESKNSISHGTKGRAAEKTEEEPQEIPSVADVSAYCDANGYTSIDPAYFVDYYDGLKWRIGGSPIYDWRAILRTWVARDRRGGRQAAPAESAPSSFDTDEFFQAALARSYGGMDFSAEAEQEEATT